MAATYAAVPLEPAPSERAAERYNASRRSIVLRLSISVYFFRTSTSTLLIPAPFIFPKIFASVVDIVPM
jgi:hypothetical protein